MNYREFLSNQILTLALGIAIVGSLAWLWFSQSVVVQKERQSQEAVQALKRRKESSTPLIYMLPVKNPFWSISYSIDEAEKVTTLTIFSRSPHYRYQAFKFLVNKDPEVTLKYKIRFAYYQNPIEEASE